MSKTLFERIVDREIPATIIYETYDLIGFNDIAPQAPYHVIIAPKRPITTVNDLESSDKELIGSMVLAAKAIAIQLGIAENGYRLVINCNSDGGQSVDHLHMHILGGRQLGWPPG